MSDRTHRGVATPRCVGTASPAEARPPAHTVPMQTRELPSYTAVLRDWFTARR
jgi:hypothetical protein